MKWLTIGIACLLVGCEWEEKTRETGHKGRARVNPFLAGERMLGEFEIDVSRERGWPDFDSSISVVMLPVSILQSENAIRQLDAWLLAGGHAILFLEQGEAYLNDWSEEGRISTWSDEDRVEVEAWLGRLGIGLEKQPASGASMSDPMTCEFRGADYQVGLDSPWRMKVNGAERALVSRERGRGRLTVLADARPFRNRYIGEHDHARLMMDLVEVSRPFGAVHLIRDASLSFWGLVWQRAAPLMIGLLVAVAFWLWKNLPRFGPVHGTDFSHGLRAYDQHLEALGDFHWRLDRGESLLRPLRAKLLDRAHHLAHAQGQPDADVFQVMAERAVVPRDRVVQAMTDERPRDAARFARLVADLQSLHLNLS